LSEVVKQNAHLLLTRQETKRLIDKMGDSHPKLVEELLPKLMTLGEVQKVLQLLLREQVSIRDLGTILETMVETAAMNKNPVLLVEAVRHTLGRALVRPLLDEKGELRVVTVDRSIEEECTRSLNPQPASPSARTPCSPIPRVGFATVCVHSSARRSSRRRQFCCVHLQRASNCGGCWSHFCPK
jgi:flagellar biosynthesis protein FlhA